MEIKTLQLSNFRNYEHLTIHFNKKVNIFIGENAQGKTNLLESIYLLAISKSHKTYRDKELIKFNYDFAKVCAEINRSQQDHLRLEVIISKQGKKVAVNGVEIPKMSEYIGKFNVVMFAPEDLDIVKRDPMNRRKFLDVEIGQISPIYIHFLNQYNKLLKQRNEYIKQVKVIEQVDMDYLDILTMQLSELAVKILEKRKEFISKLNVFANKLQNYISHDTENLQINYLSSYDRATTTEAIFNLYKKNYENDIRRGTTQLGIHRDDIEFIVNGINVSHFGSQGQQRTTALAIKLSLIDFIKSETGYYPIVLLDDVLSELDDKRQSHLLDCIKEKVQTFVTTTSIAGIKPEILDKSDIFVIKNAKITSKEGVYDGSDKEL